MNKKFLSEFISKKKEITTDPLKLNLEEKSIDGICVAPWMHLHVINDGNSFACCQTPLTEENSFGNVKSKKLIDILNSPRAKMMRRNMMQGKGLPLSCERCSSKERVGLNSMRTGFNDKWLEEIKPLIEKTQEDGTIPELQLKYWDFRFSNYCNLACTTCSPLFSTQWASDWMKLHPNKGKYSETHLIDLEKASLFWNDIENNLEHMKEIHFAGGEPLIMPEHWRILKLLNEKKRYDIDLRYSTNGTTLGRDSEDVFNYWKKFKYVHLSLSIDGAEEAYEYIRYRGKWKVTFENLKKIRNSEIVDYWIHPTVSVLNIFRLTELHEILHKADLIPLKVIHKNAQYRIYNIESYWVNRFHINPLFTPEYYSIKILPQRLKDRVAEKITSYGKKLEKETGIPFSGWQNIIDFMYSENQSGLFLEFKEKVKKIDEIRGNNVFSFNPELLL